MKHKAKLISIMTEKVFEKNIIEFLEQSGAKGYTIFEGGGNGSFHLHQSQHAALIDEFRIVKIEVIMLEAEKAEDIAVQLVEDFFVDMPGIVSLSDVEVFRSQRF